MGTQRMLVEPGGMGWVERPPALPALGTLSGQGSGGQAGQCDASEASEGEPTICWRASGAFTQFQMSPENSKFPGYPQVMSYKLEVPITSSLRSD